MTDRTRRQFLLTTGALTMAALAGCSEDDPSAEEGTVAQDTDSPTQTDTGGSTDTDTATETPTPTETESSAVEILDHEFKVVEEYDSDAVDDDYAVVGTGRNNSDDRLDVFIEVRFFDADDVQIDSSNANQNGVQPDGKFSFEAPFLGDDAENVDRYEIGWEAYEA